MPRTPDRRSGLAPHERLLLLVFAGLLCAVLVTALVDGDQRAPGPEAAQEQTRMRQEVPERGLRDVDGDGTPDEQDGDPLDASSTAPPPSADPGPAECMRRGITPGSRREGDCTTLGGSRVRVVNAGRTVSLADLRARLHEVRVLKRLPGGITPGWASGRYVVARLTITNLGRRPHVFYDAQFGVRVDDVVVGQDIAAAVSLPDGLTPALPPLAPGRERTGRVVFEVDAVYARGLLRHGVVVVAGFDDAGVSRPQRRVAFIRTPRDGA